ncbi:TIGR04104 family putative zinc finger protein [Faecalimicrobium sp. JNUCC 81]
MKNCIECNHEFTYLDRLKTIFSFNLSLKCPKCNSLYEKENNLCRGGYYVLIIFLGMFIYDYIDIDNFILETLIYIIIAILAILLFDIFPHKWNKYIKIK